jgi:hypothetical protein
MKNVVSLRLLAFFTVLTVSLAASGQDKLGWSVRPFVGLNISDIGGNDGPEYYHQRTGFACGADVEYRWSRLFGVSAGLHYSVLGSTTEEGNYKSSGYKDQMVYSESSHYDRYSLRYLSLPLMVNVHAWKGLRIGLGLQFSKLLAARKLGTKTRYDNMDFVMPDEATLLSDWDGVNAYYRGLPVPQATAENMSNPVRSEESLNIGVRNSFNNFEVAIPIGISYEYRNIELGVRYLYGLSGLYNGSSELAGSEDFKVSNRSLCISLGYRFH